MATFMNRTRRDLSMESRVEYANNLADARRQAESDAAQENTIGPRESDVDNDEPFSIVSYRDANCGVAGKFKAEDVTLFLLDVAKEYVKNYSGTFEFLTGIQYNCFRRAKPMAFTRPQAAGVLNCLYAEEKRNAANKRRGPKVTPIAFNIRYTYVWQELDEHLTVWFKPAPKWVTDKPEGTQQIKLMAGHDNDAEYQYTHIGWVYGKEFELSSHYRNDPQLQEAISVILEADDNGRRELGLNFARMEKACCVCGRVLTNPDSIEDGIGPVCAKRIGLTF